MKSTADRHKLFQDYISHYESRRHEGNVTVCDHGLECGGLTPLGELYSQLITQNLQSKTQERRGPVLKQMMKGFAILELICVNLFLFPWRKEIRTLKKFTGAFVYFVEPAIPEDTIWQILQRVGYSIASDTEYIIRGKINTEEAKQTAFELYLSRIQCEKMLWPMNKDKSIDVSPLLTEANNESEHIALTGKNTNGGSHEIDGVNNLDVKSNVTDNNDTTKAADLTSPSSSQDVISDTSTKDSSYYIKHMDSDDFLNKYSDLNFAQQPILKQNKPKEWAAPVSKEPYSAKTHIPESSVRESRLAITEGRDLAEKVTCDLQGDNIDIRTFTDKLDPPKSLTLNELPAEVVMPTKQERVVTKLKMQNMAGETLAYPIEETLPPDSAKFSDSSDLGRKEVKWSFLKTKEGTESFSSPMSLSSDFSMLNISSKQAIWTPGTENRLREPPNPTYIPPMAPKSEFMRLTNIKPEENQFQEASQSGGTLLVNEFNIHEDTKEDYVMITRKNNPQN